MRNLRRILPILCFATQSLWFASNAKAQCSISPIVPVQVVSNQTIGMGGIPWSVAMKQNGIVVKTGNTLTINNVVCPLWQGCQILVENGAKLILTNNAVLTTDNTCSLYMWEGVDVQGDITAPQGPSTGTLIMQSGARIEYAKRGVKLSGTYWENGGIVQATDAVFYNCRKAVEFFAYDTYENESFFKKCTFMVDMDQLPGYPSMTNNDAFITIFKTNGVEIYGCTFRNDAPTAPDSTRGSGIRTMEATTLIGAHCDSIVEVGNCKVCDSTVTPTRSTFEKLYVGIYSVQDVTSSAYVWKVIVENSDFSQNKVGVAINRSGDARVRKCTFFVNSNDPSTYFHNDASSNLNAIMPSDFDASVSPAIGMIMSSKSTLLKIADNTLTRRGDESLASTYGIYLLDEEDTAISYQISDIYRNTISMYNFIAGNCNSVNYVGVNCMGNPIRLNISCNNFEILPLQTSGSDTGAGCSYLYLKDIAVISNYTLASSDLNDLTLGYQWEATGNNLSDWSSYPGNPYSKYNLSFISSGQNWPHPTLSYYHDPVNNTPYSISAITTDPYNSYIVIDSGDYNSCDYVECDSTNNNQGEGGEGGGKSFPQNEQGLNGKTNRLVQAIDITLYPNPASSWVNLKLEGVVRVGETNAAERYQIRVVDMSGREVLYRIANMAINQTLRLETADLMPGSYNIIIYNESGFSTAKTLIIQ